MKIYHYNRQTGEYLYSSNATPDPLDTGKYLIPAFATTIQPLTLNAGYVSCFVNGAWRAEEDHRGTVWEKTTAKPISFRDLGPLPHTLTKLIPPVQFPVWTVDTWTVDIVAAQTAVKDAIKEKEDQRNERKYRHSDGNTYPVGIKMERVLMRISGLADAVPLPGGGTFEDADDNQITMTCGQFRALVAGVYAREDANRIVRRKHITAMKAAADPLTYDYSGGWA
jgi:hypothetical protein